MADTPDAHSALEGRRKVRLLASLMAKTGTLESRGKFGEARAKQWFQRHKLEFFEVPQTKDTFPLSLARMGGKRVDFIVDFPGERIYFDAKFHDTEGVTVFAMDDEELAQYSIFREWARIELGDDGARDVVFMVYPQEHNGDRFVVIHLDELLGGEPTIVRNKKGRKVSLLNRDDTWHDQWAENDT